jgi:hypothetical protein
VLWLSSATIPDAMCYFVVLCGTVWYSVILCDAAVAGCELMRCVLSGEMDTAGFVI